MDNKTSGTRIQKVLSDNGILSRRKAEDAIKHGRITVNGHPCTLGQKINPRKDIVAIDGENIRFERKKQNLYIMLNKPRGYVTTTSDEHGRQCVTDLVADAPAKVYPAGRLDRNSEGLLIMTNDGNFANMIMHPSHHVTKTYRVTTHSSVSEQQIINLSTGVEIDGKMTMPATVLILSQEPGRCVMQITISEGRNRQIRKMCEAVNIDVARLKRTSVGPLRLGMLQPGKWRELTSTELTAIRNASQKAANISKNERQRNEKQKREAAKQGGHNDRRRENFSRDKSGRENPRRERPSR